MKLITKLLGGSLISAVVVLSIFLILNNITYTKYGNTFKGILEIIGASTNIEGNEYLDSYSSVFENIAASPKPEIYFDNKEQEKLFKDQDIEILKYFRVKFDSVENLISADNLDETKLKIMDITNKNGNSVLFLYDSQLKTINFDYADIYTLTFYLMDDNQKETIAKIQIPVN